MKKRILFIQPLLPFYRIDFFLMLNEFNDVTVFASDVSNNDVGFKTINSRTFKYFDKIFWQTNLFKVNFRNYDLVIFNVNPRYISTLLALIYCKYLGVKTLDYNHLRSSTSKGFFIICRELILKILTIGRIVYTKEEYLISQKNKKLIKYKCPIIGFANNSINTKKLIELSEIYNPLLRSDFLFIGRLTLKSNIELLIKALSFSKYEYRVNIIGDENNNSNYFKDLALKYGVSKKIVWHHLTNNEIYISSIMNKCRCFVYPGGVGLSLIHGMSYGLPAIIHNNKNHHNPECSAFKDKYTGLNFIENDSESLSKTMDNLYFTNPTKLQYYSENSLEVIKKEFSLEIMTDNFNKVFNQIM